MEELGQRKIGKPNKPFQFNEILSRECARNSYLTIQLCCLQVRWKGTANRTTTYYQLLSALSVEVWIVNQNWSGGRRVVGSFIGDVWPKWNYRKQSYLIPPVVVRTGIITERCRKRGLHKLRRRKQTKNIGNHSRRPYSSNSMAGSDVHI